MLYLSSQYGILQRIYLKKNQLKSKVLGKNALLKFSCVVFSQAVLVDTMHTLYSLWNCKFVILDMTCFLPFFPFVFIACSPP